MLFLDSRWEFLKILYRQRINSKKENGSLSSLGVNNCYFKSIRQSAGVGEDTKKRHSHTGFEFHVMIEGRQIYKTETESFLLEGGKVLAVPKGVPHMLSSSTYPVKKYAFTFSVDESRFDKNELKSCFLFPIPERVMSNISAMTELHTNFVAKNLLVENCIFKTVILLLREIGITQTDEGSDSEVYVDNNEDERVELARQFIADNVDEPIQTGEVASYCYISEKQLNRLFLADMGMSVAAYVRCQRIRRIEELLSCSKMTLGEISARMGFPNEHSFNVFFKKHNGMPPGEYRKMTTNGKG
jgi:AraC-like DNA-binding protein/mannose-6-phosphate isomerase-like protein (cupin superfamily)